MINSFRHKGLKNLYEKGNEKGINPQWLKRVKLVLVRLDASSSPSDMDLPGLRLHALRGEMLNYWAVTVTGNWRIIFRFEDDEPCDIDLVDYH